MSSVVRPKRVRGVFLDKTESQLPRPEITVLMQFSTRQELQDPVTNVVTEQLVDSQTVTAISFDQGKTFKVGPHGDVDGDGDVDGRDRAKLVALAKAYAAITTP